jgi:hypothetical protein
VTMMVARRGALAELTYRTCQSAAGLAVGGLAWVWVDPLFYFDSVIIATLALLSLAAGVVALRSLIRAWRAR